MAVRFDDSEFRFSHGKAPRGRGGWAFKFRVGREFVLDPSANVERLGRDCAEAHFAPGGLSFGEAKKWARAKAAELGADLVKVCS